METFGKVYVVFRSGAVCNNTIVLLHYKGLTEKKKLLKNELLLIAKRILQWKGLEKLSKKQISIITIAGIPLELWRSKVFEKMLTTNHSAFFKIFRAPYLHDGYRQYIYFFAHLFMGYRMMAFIFQFKIFHFSAFFLSR